MPLDPRLKFVCPICNRELPIDAVMKVFAQQYGLPTEKTGSEIFDDFAKKYENHASPWYIETFVEHWGCGVVIRVYSDGSMKSSDGHQYITFLPDGTQADPEKVEHIEYDTCSGPYG